MMGKHVYDECGWVVEQLPVWLGGGLTREETGRLALHLASCPACMEALAVATRLQQAAADLAQRAWAPSDAQLEAVFARVSRAGSPVGKSESARRVIDVLAQAVPVLMWLNPERLRRRLRAGVMALVTPVGLCAPLSLRANCFRGGSTDVQSV